MPSPLMATADPAIQALVALPIILIGAAVGGRMARAAGQPRVLGELVAGVLLGNLGLAGISWLGFIRDNSLVGVVAALGALVLLFETGLESTIGEMKRVGASSLLVAVLGVVTPFALGWGVGALLLPDRSAYVHAFLGATLTATSVGITARVLKDLDHSTTAEARIILGAAVIDDVLGLMILAVVGGVIAAANAGTAFRPGQAMLILLKAGLFLFGALALGAKLSPALFRYASMIRSRGVMIVTALAFCLVLAWLAGEVGLAPIVGAYAAGLIIEKAHLEVFADRGERRLEDQLFIVSRLTVPVFFVLMGMRVDLAALGRPGVLGLAALVTLAAIVGKQVCGLGALERGLDRLTIGLGMIPRGEVGLIFANVGLGLTVAGERVVDGTIYAAVVIMVMATTLVTPPALKWSLRRSVSR